MVEVPTAQIEWHPCFRIVPSRFPPIGLFEAVADPRDLEAVYQIEAMTNDRLREEVGDILLVAPDDRVSGPGTTPIMAARGGSSKRACRPFDAVKPWWPRHAS